MRFLIDTHTFVWLDSAPHQLSTQAAAIIANDLNTLWFSHASIWELQIKLQLGKLRLSKSLTASLETQRQKNRLVLLPIQVKHILTLDLLPHHHRDPFDRLLIAQSMDEGIPILSRDPAFRQYPVKVIW
jgi:PIN domain nuclease of toxin-antitoxin system